MSTYQPDDPYQGPDSGRSQIGQQVVLLLLICVALVLLYNIFFSDGSSSLTSFFQPSKEVKLTYVPSDFNPNLDEEATLRVLAQPDVYAKEFDDIVYHFNVNLLYHVASRMSLPDSLKRRLEPEYVKHHQYLKTLYYNDFVALKDTSATLYETWYNDNANQAVELFSEVAGKYTCFFVTQIMATLLKADNGKLMAKGDGVDSPCGIAIREGLQPLVERLKKKAAIMDFSASQGLLKERVRKGIAELATYELQSRLALDKTLQYELFGYAISETDIRVEAISVIKAGFKLNDYLDVTYSPSKEVVYVTLPQPVILSHEVYPKIEKLDVGFLAGITGEEMNRNFNELRRQFREEAIGQERVLDKAKERADSVMTMLIGPTVGAMGRKVKLEVRFAEQQGQPPADKNDTKGDDEPPPPKLSDPAPPSIPQGKRRNLAN